MCIERSVVPTNVYNRGRPIRLFVSNLAVLENHGFLEANVEIFFFMQKLKSRD